ncbi:MAG: RNase J family beta-CASP ribonuclease [Nanoarchaeota archaeon]
MKIHTIGGFSEVGKNMVALETGDDAFIFDEGFHLPPIVQLEEKEKVHYNEKKLKSIQAIPEDSVINDIRNKVRAQFIGHAHLDHIGAVPFISDKYNAPIYGAPFTLSVLNSLLKDNDLNLKNNIKQIPPNNSFFIKGKEKKYKVDFINMTHSTLQTCLVAIHTNKGVVLYANDFKLDNNPIVGLKPNYSKLMEIAKEGVYAFIVDSLYSGTDRKTPSEKIARALLEESLLNIQNKNSGIIVTTFSSHIARLKSVVEFGKKLDREVIFLGRSLDKYVTAARESNLAPFLDGVKMFKYRRQVEKILKNVEKNRSKYLVVCTGHQGEPGSILERISKNQLPLRVNHGDNVIFSSSVIPTDVNIANFEKMENRLKKRKARIFRDVHVSGHAGREDLRDMINLLSPQHIIPAHGGLDKTQPMAELASELGYKLGKQCHLIEDGEVLKL